MDNQNFDSNLQRQFLVYVLSELLPAAKIITQQDNTWILSARIQGLEFLNGKTFGSRDNLIGEIASYYVGQVTENRVSGFKTGAGQSTRKAV